MNKTSNTIIIVLTITVFTAIGGGLLVSRFFSSSFSTSSPTPTEETIEEHSQQALITLRQYLLDGQSFDTLQWGTDTLSQTTQHLAASIDRQRHYNQRLSDIIAQPFILLKFSPADRLNELTVLSRAIPYIQAVDEEIAAYKKTLVVVGNTADLQQALTHEQERLAALASDAHIIPTVLGYPTERTYLLLFQNNTELRPAGGFIGSFGVLVMDHGEIKTVGTNNVYDLDQYGYENLRLLSPSPEPIKRYLGVDHLFFRDANWSPDFVQSSLALLDIYHRERTQAGIRSSLPTAVDGIISVTPTVIEQLAALVGPLRVDSITFRPETFTQQLERYVEFDYRAVGLTHRERKDILQPLATSLRTQLEALDVSKRLQAAAVLNQGLTEKHILLYDTDPTIEQLWDRIGVSGRVTSAEPLDDYLMVVDANLASLKTDAVMERSIEHTISLESNAMIATTKITYHNSGRLDWRTTRYRTYTRLYVPLGSTLLASSGALNDDLQNNPRGTPGVVDQHQELGKTVFGAFTAIEPQATRQLLFRYRLPFTIDDIRRHAPMSIIIQKQPGIITLPLTIRSNIGTIRPLHDIASNGHSELQMTITGDQRFLLDL